MLTMILVKANRHRYSSWSKVSSFYFNSFKARWKYHAYLLSSFFKDVLRKITMHCVLQAQSGDYVWFFLANVTHQIRLRFVKEIFSCSNSVQNATCDFSLGTKLMLGRSFPLQRWGFCRIYSVFFAFAFVSLGCFHSREDTIYCSLKKN